MRLRTSTFLDRLTVACVVLAGSSAGVAYYFAAVFWKDRPADVPELQEATVAMTVVTLVTAGLGLVVLRLLRSSRWAWTSSAAVIVALVGATAYVASTIGDATPAPDYGPYLGEAAWEPLLIPPLWPLVLLATVTVVRRMVTGRSSRAPRSPRDRSSARGRRSSV